jgi:hypothetical protein
MVKAGTNNHAYNDRAHITEDAGNVSTECSWNSHASILTNSDEKKKIPMLSKVMKDLHCVSI